MPPKRKTTSQRVHVDANVTMRTAPARAKQAGISQRTSTVNINCDCGTGSTKNVEPSQKIEPKELREINANINRSNWVPEKEFSPTDMKLLDTPDRWRATEAMLPGYIVNAVKMMASLQYEEPDWKKRYQFIEQRLFSGNFEKSIRISQAVKRIYLAIQTGDPNHL